MRNMIIILLLVFASIPIMADGLLVPVDENYPKDFLRHRMTHVTIKIHGLIAETEVYQEFKNDWDQSVDAVYSFPLPPDARATEFVYWANDKVYRAVLKVREQATTPGTGQGGVIARVNKYIGRNGIKVSLRDIKAGDVQKVKLFYVSQCDYFAGEARYQFPLDTGDFVSNSLDQLQFSVFVDSESEITSYDIPSHPEYAVIQEKSKTLHLEMKQPKAWTAKDFEFKYTVAQNDLGVDFYSVANDTVDGHFVLNVRPGAEAADADVFPRRILFVLSNSSNMFGYKLNQCISAVETFLAQLGDNDLFNIIVYNGSVSSWKSAPTNASGDNVTAAKNFLASVQPQWGSRMDRALDVALGQIGDSDYINSIVLLSDGRSPIDPKNVETTNAHKAGIFPIGIGDDLDRARLEMTAALNYGFVTYFDEDDNIRTGVEQLLQKISRPIMKDVVMEFGRADLHDILPEKYPALYAGSRFMITGRYSTPAQSGLAMAGLAKSGVASFDFQLDFTDETTINKFAERLWAKEKIDALERDIEIYGETPTLRAQATALSLQYNIRCRYTAYVADYETEYTGVEEKLERLTALPESYLMRNFPNPFNPSTTIQFIVAEHDAKAVKLIKIYDALGRLVAVIDVSHLGAGQHAVLFDGRDFFGNKLPSGQYFVRLQVGDVSSTLRIVLAK
jgi:Ca-activated chloride channel homolog